MAYYKEAEYTTKVVVRRRQYTLVPLINSTLTLNSNSNPDSLSNKDISIADINNDIGALDFPGDIEDIGEMEIRGPSRIGDSLTTLSSNELSDLLITQVTKNEINSKSDDDNEDKVISSTYPPSI
jgi:hypothetical protein